MIVWGIETGAANDVPVLTKIETGERLSLWGDRQSLSTLEETILQRLFTNVLPDNHLVPKRLLDFDLVQRLNGSWQLTAYGENIMRMLHEHVA
jgi:hypothetical protein